MAEEDLRAPWRIRSTLKFDEKMALCRRWDDLQLLRLFPAEECSFADIAEPFPVRKTEEDRQIIDKRRRNRREERRLRSSRTMGHGALLNHLCLGPDEVICSLWMTSSISIINSAR